MNSFCENTKKGGADPRASQQQGHVGWLAERTFLAGEQLVQGASWRWGRPAVSGEGCGGWWSVAGLCVAGREGRGQGQPGAKLGRAGNPSAMWNLRVCRARGEGVCSRSRWLLTRDHSGRAGARAKGPDPGVRAARRKMRNGENAGHHPAASIFSSSIFYRVYGYLE